MRIPSVLGQKPHAEFELADRSLEEQLPASASSHVEHLLQLHVHRLEN